jgi:hypothetical protein
MGNTLTSIFSVIASICKGLVQYATAFEVSGRVVTKVVETGEKHVDVWTLDQDLKVAEARARVAALENKAKNK